MKIAKIVIAAAIVLCAAGAVLPNHKSQLNPKLQQAVSTRECCDPPPTCPPDCPLPIPPTGN